MSNLLSIVEYIFDLSYYLLTIPIYIRIASPAKCLPSEELKKKLWPLGELVSRL